MKTVIVNFTEEEIPKAIAILEKARKYIADHETMEFICLQIGPAFEPTDLQWKMRAGVLESLGRDKRGEPRETFDCYYRDRCPDVGGSSIRPIARQARLDFLDAWIHNLKEAQA